MIVLLYNPVAGGGRAPRLVERAKQALDRVAPVEVFETQYAGHERELAAVAAARGARAVVVHGGDGSLSHAAHGLIAAGAATPLAVLAAGTGNDFAKSLGAPVYDYAATAALIGDGAVRRIDAGTIDGKPFINVAGFGFDAEVLANMLPHGALPARARYATSALGRLFGYRGFEATLSVLDAASKAARPAQWLTIVFANGSWFGGTFHIAPQATLDDGMLDCVAVSDATAARRVALFTQALRGQHVQAPEVQLHRGASFVLQFDAPPRFQADGEIHTARQARVEVSVLPGVLAVVARGATAQETEPKLQTRKSVEGELQ